MQRPSTGDLLAGLRKGLTETVLPALPRGPAQAQLKAALHLLGRLERTWDLAQAHLVADTADIEAVLGDRIPHAADAAPPTGYNDPELRALAAHNLALHERLEAVEPTAEIEALFRRMAARDSVFVGDAP
ncbi:hypothetical protein [Novosphingobium lentum]|uniref:hypothetical protein n=1 Tax=Novosphingobium lentum TaxID=145287 RepID=UPI00082CD137|nr:hypothetical protein [Novosphingobium lentum]